MRIFVVLNDDEYEDLQRSRKATLTAKVSGFIFTKKHANGILLQDVEVESGNMSQHYGGPKMLWMSLTRRVNRAQNAAAETGLPSPPGV